VSLRQRITIVGAVAVAVAVVLACTAAYIAVRGELLGQVDDQLRQQVTAIERVSSVLGGAPPADRRLTQLAPQEGGPLAYIQALRPDGTPREGLTSARSFTVNVDAVDRDVAAGRRRSALRDESAGDARLRVLTAWLGEGRGAVQLARPLNSIDSLLGRLRLILLAVCLGGVALAALLARLVTRRVTAPLRTVTDAVDHIAETHDLARRIAVSSDDEVGRLAKGFNGMLDRLSESRAALAGSVTAQRQLVADASHELRTPITSLRTNLEVLIEEEREPLDPPARARLLADLVDQTEELSALVADVIELARGDVEPTVVEDVRLDEVAAAAVEHARRHHRDIVFELRSAPVVIDGARDRLGRAIGNVIENAAKHSHAGQIVEVTVDDEGVSVRDHGPGIAAEDRPNLFDRFYRGSTSRGLPGTGLGLAIVRQVTEAHGGAVEVVDPEGGGAEFRLRLPARPLEQWTSIDALAGVDGRTG
jgi:two-component system, OmpR family, sensor histidine kinase MprB